jgi:hypothetical protein
MGQFGSWRGEYGARAAKRGEITPFGLTVVSCMAHGSSDHLFGEPNTGHATPHHQNRTPLRFVLKKGA